MPGLFLFVDAANWFWTFINLGVNHYIYPITNRIILILFVHYYPYERN